MNATITIIDMKGNECRVKSFEFTEYAELNRYVNEFELETGYRKPEVEIECEEADQDILEKIQDGIYDS